MNTVWEELADVLDAEKFLYAGLLRTGEEKRQAIIRNALSEVETLTDAEREGLRQIEICEARRVEAMQAAAELADQPPEVKLSDLIAVAPEAIGKRIDATRTDLDKTVNDLQFRARQNAKLLEICQKHATSFMEALSCRGRKSTTYTRSGNTVRGSMALMDHHA